MIISIKFEQLMVMVQKTLNIKESCPHFTATYGEC